MPRATTPDRDSSREYFNIGPGDVAAYRTTQKPSLPILSQTFPRRKELFYGLCAMVLRVVFKMEGKLAAAFVNHFSDTIFALASAAGRAGVAVVRLSGPKAGRILADIAPSSAPLKPRAASLRKLVAPAFAPSGGETIDHAIVIWFPAPRSFTGEDVAEFHVHGGKAVVEALIEALAAFPECRPAEAGEFSRRAFHNGRMDLTAAEAMADLIDAETAAQKRQAMRQMEGELGRLYDGWAEALKRVLAMAEADIDFSEEELPPDLAAKNLSAVSALLERITAHLNDGRRGERLRDGVSIAILGEPNAGKSSLLNALAGRDAAIVSPRAGTTRDVIDVHLDFGGHAVLVADTAGLREDSSDEVESEGIKRAKARAEAADIRILVLDGQKWPEADKATMDLKNESSLIVVNKSDLLSDKKPKDKDGAKVLFVSAKTGEGLKEIETAIRRKIEAMFPANADPPLTRARHRACLEECALCLRRALAADKAELMTEDLRQAMRALGRITGSVSPDDLLDKIFREFCIGK